LVGRESREEVASLMGKRGKVLIPREACEKNGPSSSYSSSFIFLHPNAAKQTQKGKESRSRKEVGKRRTRRQ